MPAIMTILVVYKRPAPGPVVGPAFWRSKVRAFVVGLLMVAVLGVVGAQSRSPQERTRERLLQEWSRQGVAPVTGLETEACRAVFAVGLRGTEPDRADDIVLEEYQTGYRLGDRILRPSRVAVNKIQQPTQGATGNQGTDASQDASEPESNVE